MNENIKQLGAFTLIIAASCAAVSLFVLSPLQQRNHSANARLASAQTVTKQLGELQPKGPLWDAQITNANALHDWYELQNELATDPARLHSQVTRLARARSIAIDRMEPQTPTTTSDTATSTGLSIEATGHFNDLTNFLADLTSECGFARIDFINFAPIKSKDDQLVHASIQTSHFALQIPSQQVVQAEPTQ